jgi:hypothetical protein
VANSNKLIRQLKREVTANPKKTAILGVSLVIAIWFWAPLIGKWTGMKSSGEELATPPAGAEQAPVTASANTTPATTAKTNTPNWHQVLAWIHKDAFMETHIPLPGERDPFSPSGSQLARHEESKSPAEPVPEMTPQTAGLMLRSTVIGTSNKTALINGRAYHEDQSVVAANGRDRFLLVEIHSNGIVLQRQGRSYEIKIPKVETADSAD